MTNEYEYIDNLMADCQEAKVAKHTQKIEANDIEPFIGIKSSVYVIQEIGGDADITYANFRKFKEQTNRKCPKANLPSQTLYVGSSVGNLATRLKQHIGCNSNEKTYALNLHCWFQGIFLITAKTYEVSPTILQIIENSLHYHLKPAFGKMGGNSRALDSR